MRTTIRIMTFASAAVLAFAGGFPQDGLMRIPLIESAHAIVGAPLTPVSYAGVARRTTRRVVVATSSAAASNAAASNAAAASASQSAEAAEKSAKAASQASAEAAQASAAAQAAGGVAIGTVVQSLPAGCSSVTINGMNYNDCGGSFYQTAFQGNNLVYVVVPRPQQ